MKMFNAFQEWLDSLDRKRESLPYSGVLLLVQGLPIAIFILLINLCFAGYFFLIGDPEWTFDLEVVGVSLICWAFITVYAWVAESYRIKSECSNRANN